jgi:N6-adenosine-specific RNA methylase IME4
MVFDDIAVPPGGFAAICADPPWHFKSRTAPKIDWHNPRHVERHYDTMSLDDIKALPVQDLAAKDCHLFLWVTGPMLQHGFAVMEAWGFRYSSDFGVWIKLKRSHDPSQLRCVATAESDLHVGLGLTSRKNAEYLLLGRRGSPKRLAKDVRQVILAPVRQHSRKPDEAYSRIERYCAGPRIELFARQRRPGWTAFGLEIYKFHEASDGGLCGGTEKGRIDRGAAGHPEGAPA